MCVCVSLCVFFSNLSDIQQLSKKKENNKQREVVTTFNVDQTKNYTMRIKSNWHQVLIFHRQRTAAAARR